MVLSLKKKIFFCHLFSLSSSILLNAQILTENKKSNIYIKAGASFNSSSVQDKTFSSLVYNGKNAGAILACDIVKAKTTQLLFVSWSKGTLKDKNYDNNLKQSLYNASFTKLYQFGSDKQEYVFMAGPQINILYATRHYPDLVNRNDNHEFAGSLAACVQGAHTFESGAFKDWTVSNRLSISIVSLIQQPAYGSEQASSNLNSNKPSVKSFLNSSRFGLPGDFLNLDNQLEFTRSLSDHSGISLSYHWYYYSLILSGSQKQAKHSAELSYIFKLN